MWPYPQFPADFVTFTEEILNGKLHFLCSGRDRLMINESTVTPKNYILSVGVKTDFFKFSTNPSCWRRKITVSLDINVSSVVVQVNCNQYVQATLQQTEILSNFVKILGAEPCPKQRQRNWWNFLHQRNRTNFLDAGFKGTEKYASFKFSLQM